MSLTKHGFVLLPDRRTMNEAIKLSKNVPENKLALDLFTTSPHLTVLQTFFTPGFNYREALKKFRGYRGFNFEPQTSLGAATLQQTSSLEYILWWNAHKAEWLKTFNSELIDELANKISKPEDADKLAFKTPQEEESYRLTGYKGNLEAYEPHITLAVTTNPMPLPTLVPKPIPVRFHYLAFVKHGDFGEITAILASEALPSSWD